MYGQTNVNQSIPVSSMQQYLPAPLMLPVQPEYNNNADSLYIPAPIYSAPETDMINIPTCMRTLIERYIGRIVRAQFLIGDALHDHVGRLMSVGTSYIVIESLKERVITICDLSSIKFITVMFDENNAGT